MNLNLDDRQKRILMISGAGVAVLLLLWTIVLPKLGIGGLDSKIAAKQRDLREMMRLYQDFEKVKKDVNAIEGGINRNKNLSLLSELSTIAEKINIKQGIESMVSKAKPKSEFYKEESVEMRLQKIKLDELANLLYDIEYSSKVLRVRKLHIEARFDDPTLLNAVLEVSTFKNLDE
ncbi:MAG: type II secretion system protein M [Myxococcales bacterium]|nr:type II secretion system protein M [Myxococcales bacterium]